MGRQWQRVEIRRKGWVARDGGGDGAKLTRHNGGADGMRTDQPTSDANRNKSGLINSPTQNVRQCKTPADCRT
uniref:Uncharacterized protein n=1 Tax=Oryza nivara TaxID=4536 RepID=A0A0E0FLQ5_ORYNI